MFFFFSGLGVGDCVSLTRSHRLCGLPVSLRGPAKAATVRPPRYPAKATRATGAMVRPEPGPWLKLQNPTPGNINESKQVSSKMDGEFTESSKMMALVLTTTAWGPKALTS